MSERLTRIFASRGGIIVAGAVIGIAASALQKLGNPVNMGICVACFERDIAGALGLHRAAFAQYIRPEIIAFVLGATIASLSFREFRARAGSAPTVRFVLGTFAMIGALASMGCPWRTFLRLAGGDLNALIGIAGLIVGVAIGVAFLRLGFDLGRAAKTHRAVGLVMPVLMLGLLLLRVFEPQFSEGGPIFSSQVGPGSQHAPWLVSLGAGLVIGFLAQRTRFCTMGAVRDVILMRNTYLLTGVAAMVVGAFLTNLTLGQIRLGFTEQFCAHSNQLWNFLGMSLAGLAFTLAGGCPGRQLFLAGEGDGDAGIFVLGMIVGAGFAQNFGLASRSDSIVETLVRVGGPNTAGMTAVTLGVAICLTIGLTMREKA